MEVKSVVCAPDCNFSVKDEMITVREICSYKINDWKVYMLPQDFVSQV